jgi:glutamate synthase domain-containing protein 2
VDEKKWRVLNYVVTIRNGLNSLAAATGLENYSQFKRDHVVFRNQYGQVTSLEKLFPYPDA